MVAGSRILKTFSTNLGGVKVISRVIALCEIIMAASNGTARSTKKKFRHGRMM
jgi:hypothetical protein